MPNQHVQVCFVADFNKSMQKHIGSMKDNFDEILDDIQNQNPTSVIEVAFVGYTGVGDIPSNICEPFTTNRKPLQRRLKNTDVSFGFSCKCKMVVEGYVIAGNLDWKFQRRILFHMGDSPSHGARYHDVNLEDSYKHGHPYWSMEEQIEKLAVNKIDVVVLKISKTTTQMEKIMQDTYCSIRQHGFYVVDLTNKLKNLDDAVHDVVKSHILRIMA